jgi:signal peptide peptidase SppA
MNIYEPLAIYAPAFQSIVEQEQKLGSLAMSCPADMGLKEYLAPFVKQRKEYQVAPSGIATIHIHSTLSNDLTELEKALGRTDYSDIIAELDQSVSDPNVKGILLSINSPGGSAVGAPEAAQAVYQARQSKPIVASIQTLCASAAIYTASAANAIIAQPSAIVGSIGTINTHMEFSRMLENIGGKATIFTPAQSDLKATGNQVRPMTDAEKAFMQERIEAMNAQFTGWVQTHRPSASLDSMRGQWFSGSEAVSLGLIDQTGGTREALQALNALISIS